MLTRRSLLKTALGALGLGVLGGSAVAATEPAVPVKPLLAAPKPPETPGTFRVFYSGSEPLSRGRAVCYTRNVFITDKARTRTVELFSFGNQGRFAGICAEDCLGSMGGRHISIYGPGTVCMVAFDAESIAEDIEKDRKWQLKNWGEVKYRLYEDWERKS